MRSSFPFALPRAADRARRRILLQPFARISARPRGETPWIYERSDVPQDKEWLFGEMDNGVRYAVRKNGVPPGQVSIRVRIDAGSLHEQDSERGYAHLLEHLLFRESKYLGPAEAIPTWQRLGATFGSDTNAETSPTQTVFKLDLPNVDAAKLDESMKLLSGMVRAAGAERCQRQGRGPDRACREARTRRRRRSAWPMPAAPTLFAGQRLAERAPIGTEQSLAAATGASVSGFYHRWYRPENAVIVVAGDMDPMLLAAQVEKWFGDWKGTGAATPAPDFGDPVAPAGADPANPVGEVSVMVEPDLPRSFTYAVMRPWRPVDDTIAYNEGLLRDSLAQALINRRLEARARAGGSYLYAQVSQDDVSRSADMTFVSFAPLSGDWESALAEVRGVIADALASPPSREEIDRELAEFEIVFESSVEQRRVMAGARLADDIVNAVDIREAVAAPETVLTVFNSMRDSITPEKVLEHTRALFDGAVIRAAYVTPAAGEATPEAIRAALAAPVEAAEDARIAAQAISFDDLPAIGEPGTIARQGPIGVLDIERVDFANGVKALLWSNDAEPGRVAVKVRFGAGYRAFDAEDAVYAALGETALIGSGIGELGQEELDRISTGRKMGFDFAIDDGAFTFSAQTRQQDLADQLYLFAAKLAMPRWDPNPVNRAKAAARLAYESYATNPGGVLGRDLDYLLRDSDPRFRTPDAGDARRRHSRGLPRGVGAAAGAGPGRGAGLRRIRSRRDGRGAAPYLRRAAAANRAHARDSVAAGRLSRRRRDRDPLSPRRCRPGGGGDRLAERRGGREPARIAPARNPRAAVQQSPARRHARTCRGELCARGQFAVADRCR